MLCVGVDDGSGGSNILELLQRNTHTSIGYNITVVTLKHSFAVMELG